MRTVLAAVLFLLPVCSHAQAPINVQAEQNLPSAPLPQAASNQAAFGQTVSGQTANAQQPSLSPVNPGRPMSLSLKQAEALALKNNPQVSVARLTALASQQVTREARSSLWPAATANLTGVDADPGSRITAGALNNPTVYQRAAGGVTVNQLITDFGRTTNLTASANYAAG
jgi:outer membrane protein